MNTDQDEKIIEMLATLAEARGDLATAKAHKKALESTIEYIEAADAVKHHGEGVGAIESILRDYALEVYKEHQDKNIGHGVKARSKSTVDYKEEEAFNWALRMFPAALKLNRKAFNDYVFFAKNVPDFVNISKKDTITLPGKIKL